MEPPVGFRFRPNDNEKIAYLLSHVTGKPLSGSHLIRTADLYGCREPWDIFGDSYEEDEQYFFSTLKKVGNKKKNNDEYKRYTRNVGKGGTWSNKGQKIPITGKRGGLIGHKKCFRYVSSKNEDDRINGVWLLKEYTLPDNIASKNVKVKDEYKDCVLCVLKRKMKKKNTRVTDHDQSPRVESGLVDNNEVLSGSAINNQEMTRVDQTTQRVESGLVNSYEVLSGSATNNLEMTRVDQSTPRVESGLVNNYEVLSGSAMNNLEMTRVDQSPRVESGWVNNYEVFSGLATNNNFDNFGNYDDHVNGDTPEMRAIAKSFVEEEKSYLQMKSNYENNNIDFLGGCLPVSFIDYLAAADCTPMELLY
ncbi:hypothetical protein CASFOL_032993 [Castilleja foliolosa]|uniref:NAC domain-containing protein n=1 Tax=Castilleja foliolosa TaxID=1961234 RepID=A0ABD3C3Q0_9LAMI